MLLFDGLSLFLAFLGNLKGVLAISVFSINFVKWVSTISPIIIIIWNRYFPSPGFLILF